MWGILQVCTSTPVLVYDLTLYSELTDPQKLLPLILQPGISNLSPDIIAVYIQAATKIFGFYAAEVAQRWIDDDLHEVKAVVQMVIERVEPFVSSSHIEVQERVRLRILLQFNLLLICVYILRLRTLSNYSTSYWRTSIPIDPDRLEIPSMSLVHLMRTPM